MTANEPTEVTYPRDQLLFLALGGAGEIGMNLSLYGYGGKWLMPTRPCRASTCWSPTRPSSPNAPTIWSG
ncbi:MAG: hypothetical protein ACT7A5_23555 [Ferrovibrionaceae bacterium]